LIRLGISHTEELFSILFFFPHLQRLPRLSPQLVYQLLLVLPPLLQLPLQITERHLAQRNCFGDAPAGLCQGLYPFVEGGDACLRRNNDKTIFAS
jgi:hypothetical protein